MKSENTYKAVDEMKYPLSYPLSLGIWVTNRCNLTCIHCAYSCDQETTNNELTDSEIYDLLDYSIKKRIRCVDFTGGEPFLRSGILDMIKYGADGKLNVTMVTNGILINSNTASKLADTNIYRVRVSLDGARPTTHEFLRGKGAFEKTIKGLDNLLERSIPTNIITVVHKKNINEIEDLIRFAEKKNIETVKLIPLLPVGRAKQLKDYVLNPQEWKQLLEFEMKSTQEGKYSTEIDADGPLSVLFENSMEDTYGGCIAGRTYLGVLADGTISACPVIVLPLDNIRRNSIESVWQNNKIIKELRDPSLLKGKCKDCNYKLRCFGGCRAYAYIERGDYTCPDPFCWM